MDSISIQGHVDDEHRLSAIVPGSVPPGPVTVWIGAAGPDDNNAPEEDDAGAAWMAGVSEQWREELSDAREDLYTLADGESVDSAS